MFDALPPNGPRPAAASRLTALPASLAAHSTLLAALIASAALAICEIEPPPTGFPPMPPPLDPNVIIDLDSLGGGGTDDPGPAVPPAAAVLAKGSEDVEDDARIEDPEPEPPADSDHEPPAEPDVPVLDAANEPDAAREPDPERESPAGPEIASRERAGHAEGAPDGHSEGLLGGHPDGVPHGVLHGDPNAGPGGAGYGVGPGPGDGPVTLTASMTPPKRIRNVEPGYPAIARKIRVEGTVVLEAVIGVDGRVKDVKVIESIAMLDRAAVNAVRRWRYEPATISGRPVAVYLTVRVTFSLR